MSLDVGFDHAIRAAANSTIRTHRTGCAVYDRAGQLLATGWSHVPPGTSRRPRGACTPRTTPCPVYRHALAPTRRSSRRSRRNGNITRGDPCSACADILRRRGVRVIEATQRPGDT
jgi:deoxycytidylate deaminase